MASYTLNAGDIAAYNKTLAAATEDTVTFARAEEYVEVYTDGTSAIYFTVDGSAPAVDGARSLLLPASPAVRTVKVPRRDAPTVVKLISAGTPKYSVAKQVA